MALNNPGKLIQRWGHGNWTSFLVGIIQTKEAFWTISKMFLPTRMNLELTDIFI